MVDYYVPQGGADSTQLERSTTELVDGLKKGDSNLKAEKSMAVNLGGKLAMKTQITTKTSTGVDQSVSLYTVVRQAGLWHLVTATPVTDQGMYEPIFQQMIATVIFPNDVP
jgi:hypothetical protein